MAKLINNLRKIREKRGLSRTELGYKSGVSERYVAFIEAGEKNPSLKTALNFASTLNCKVDDIFLPSNCTESTI